MSGSVELDADGAHLLIRFPYREDLVAMVKDLPGRRWDPRGKVWRVPAAHVDVVYAACARHLFEFGPDIAALLAGTLRVAATAPTETGRATAAATARQGERAAATAVEAAPAPQALTVSQLNERVRDGLREQFRDAFWVVGEIVNFDKGANREHRFFALVEKAEGQPHPQAVVEAALFGGTAERLLPRLAAGEPPLTLRDGLEIRALVKVDLFVKSGRYQVVVQDIDSSFTLGKLSLSRERILRELADKGLDRRNRSLGHPVPPLRIGVLTSPEADGWNDFLRHVEEARCGFELTLFPIKVQGPELRPTLLRGLEWFAARSDDFDLLCILRGGGSRSDLAWFDDREVAFAVARHPLAIVVGIGHQRDQSVLDVIAHSEKTPTAVADFLVRQVEAAREDVQQRAQRLVAAVRERLVDERHQLSVCGRALAQSANDRLRDERAALRLAAGSLTAATSLRLERERSRVAQAAQRTERTAARRLERADAVLEQAATRLRLLDPRRVLERGYAVVRAPDGSIVTSTKRLAGQQRVQIQLRDGRIDTRIDHVHPDES